EIAVHNNQVLCLGLLVLGLVNSILRPLAGEDADKSPPAPEGWQTWSPRDEIRPDFRFDPEGGRDHRGSFIIRHDEREGLDGCWTKTFAVSGGKYYRFHAVRRVEDVPTARRSAVARVLWLDDRGRKVEHDRPADTGFLKGFKAAAEPEYPTDKSTDADGWTEVSDIYRAPSAATQGVIELTLRW